MAPRRQQRNSEDGLGRGAEEGQDRIPKDRVDAMIASAKEDTDRTARAEERAKLEKERRLEAEARASQPAAEPKPDPPKVYTREELQGLVDDGKITTDQMSERMDAQRDAKIRQEVSKEMEGRLSARDRKQRLDTEIDRYMAAVPGIEQDGSDDRARLEKEYRHLVSDLGMTADLQTEVVALRTLFGDVSKHEKVERETADPDDATPASGSGTDDEGDDEISGSPPKGLSGDRKRHYERMISDGRYSGWDDKDLIAEMSYIPGVKVKAA